jgi:hypothetical protein
MRWVGTDFSECGGFAEADEFAKFGVVVEAIKIGVPCGPVGIAPTGGDDFLQCCESF